MGCVNIVECMEHRASPQLCIRSDDPARHPVMAVNDESASVSARIFVMI
jgi:hypothetical protein